MLSPAPPLNALDPEGLRHFEELRREAVDAVSARFASEHDAVYAQFGARGREACRDDLTFHLEFLRPVLEFGILQPLVDYLRWLDGVLTSRDIPAMHLAQSLNWLGDFYAARMPGGNGVIVAAALEGAKAAFLLEQPAALAGPVAPEPWVDSEIFERALLAGDRREAESIFDRSIAQGFSLVDAELHLIQPALYRIGQQWQDNKVTVAQEHLATAISQALMSRGLYRAVLAPANGGKVLLGCVEGNQHAVGLQMVADAFQLAGWQVQFLGANVPTAALGEQVGRFKPDLLGLSVSFAHQLRVVRQIMARITQEHGAARPAVILGGLAINHFSPLASQLGADAWGSNARAAVDCAARLGQPRARVPEA
jgi:methanogenic corrinoid protein MtbC1